MAQRRLNPTRRALISLLALPPCWYVGAAQAVVPMPTGAMPPAEVRIELPQSRKWGSARMTYFFFRVYDMHLWANADFDASRYDQLPLALQLDYARSLDGVKIAERSMTEMLRGGEIAADKQSSWLAAMTKAFPNVVEGDRITGVQIPAVATRFFVNGRLTGEVRDAEFTRLFFGIWLSPRTSEPKLRAGLLAQLLQAKPAGLQ
jgi:hypothetical protein